MEQMIYLYIFAILILITVYISLKQQSPNSVSAATLFQKVVLLTAFMLIVDIAHEHLNGANGTGSGVLLTITTLLVFGLPVFIALIWFFYTHHLLYRVNPKMDFKFILFLMPITLNTIFTFVSLIWPLYFSIDANNVYSRGSIYYVSIILQYFYMIFPIIMVIANYKKVSREKFFPLVFFSIPPMIAGVIQALNYGLLLIWPALSFSVFLVFVFIQSRMVITDYLTGLKNKGAFENHINNLNMKTKSNKVLSIVILDLDGLKTVNDRHGHLVGDKALNLFAQNMMNSFGHRDYLARIGGDEFAVLKYVDTELDLIKSLDAFYENIQILNKSKVLPEPISYSYGYKVYLGDESQSIKGMIEEVDKLMYEAKFLKVRI